MKGIKVCKRFTVRYVPGVRAEIPRVLLNWSKVKIISVCFPALVVFGVLDLSEASATSEVIQYFICCLCWSVDFKETVTCRSQAFCALSFWNSIAYDPLSTLKVLSVSELSSTETLFRRRIPSEGHKITRDDMTEQNKTEASQYKVNVIVTNTILCEIYKTIQSNSVRRSKLTLHSISRYLFARPFQSSAI